MTSLPPTEPAEVHADAGFRPALDWSGFLESAPWFATAIVDLVEPEAAQTLAPLPRAAWYFTLFDGEISNGGVMQYFYNQALRLEGFDRIPEFIAQHPVLAQALPFAEEVHAAWAELAPAVRDARSSDEWPEALFQQHGPRFEKLTTDFYAVHHAITRGLEAAIVQSPDTYFDIAPVDGLAAKGVTYIELRGGAHRLRFADGFPCGPNLLEKPDGSCDMVWFTADRQVLELQHGNNRQWIHYPSLASGALRFNRGRLESHSTDRALWQHHGISQRFRSDGSVSNTQLHRLGRQLLHEFQQPDGAVTLRIEAHADGERHTRYWPSGSLNTETLVDKKYLRRYLCCLDENGVDLAPGGTGRLLEMLTQENGVRSWLEGELVGGLMEGSIMRVEKNLSNDAVTRKVHAVYSQGRDRNSKAR